MREDELAEKVKACLMRGKFLIVMDDIQCTAHWSEVSVALPTNNHGLKIIITSRFMDVAMLANPRRPAFKMGLLEDAHSEQLLQYVVFGAPKWGPPEIEAHGKLIAHHCKGLPLAIEVIGGIISRNVSAIGDNAAKVTTAWEKFSRTVRKHLVDDPEKIMGAVISLIYRKLPYHLKACFLYLGMFPRDFEIPTWKLFRMWIAEGFVREKNFSLEETAETYLNELISRNLVSIGKRSSDGKIKTCRIDNSLWGFCKMQAGYYSECFFKEIKIDDGKLPKKTTGYRRLCIHSNVIRFISSKPLGTGVRSIVCFSKEDLSLKAEHISAIPSGFKLLRVLDVKPMNFPKIPSGMFDLLHLRFIHLSLDFSVLPKAISNLSNLQTVIVDTNRRVLDIRADIWKLCHLRSMKTNATAVLPQPAKDSARDEHNIQTLGAISPESCTDIVLDKACNLKRVSICGNLSILLSCSRSTAVSFDYMVKLSKLEKLKLQNDVFPRPSSEGKMPYLPPSHAFPPNLKILTLSDTFLDWSQMRVLASLDNLEVLKLKDNAFMGTYWKVADGGFNHLRALFIAHTDLVVWEMSAGDFPELTRLELRNCYKLREVPIEFAEKPSLDVLIVNNCRSAAPSAKRIQDRKVEILEAKGSEGKEFRLSIFPPFSK